MSFSGNPMVNMTLAQPTMGANAGLTVIRCDSCGKEEVIPSTTTVGDAFAQHRHHATVGHGRTREDYASWSQY